MCNLTTRDLAALVGGELRGRGDRIIDDVAGLDDATGAQVTFLEAAAAETHRKTAAGAVILAAENVSALGDTPDADLIIAAAPLDAFITAMLHFRPPSPTSNVGRSPLARISPTATIGAGCQIFPGATIQHDVVLGDRCVIHPGVVIGPGCRIGNDTTIHANAVLYSGVTLGERVIVHATAVIGADGFGYRFREGRFVRIPHTGTVRIEDDVEIGAGTTIDRAMIGATVIGAGTKLDNQVMIAHNCRIGKHNAFASQVGLAGSVTTGDYVRCGGQVGVADHAHLGTGSSIGGKAGVHGRVPDGEEYHGYPAGPAKEQYRIVMAVQRAPEMRRQIRDLEKQLARLQSQLTSLLGTAEGLRSSAPAA
ncbi:MAG: UDP-3-O-(3-hydroxymyristoyl)glucosamine N-acyltransferase [Planctomycetaceae bacterium]|nr:UDP-3-O-(3-hydroxymyristoyl)glucosamine N-acyltransferase [Planctomycetaceae bacterium]